MSKNKTVTNAETLEESANQETKEDNIKYSRNEILASNKFSGVSKDMLSILLIDSKEYTINQCKDILNKEKERVIK